MGKEVTASDYITPVNLSPKELQTTFPFIRRYLYFFFFIMIGNVILPKYLDMALIFDANNSPSFQGNKYIQYPCLYLLYYIKYKAA